MATSRGRREMVAAPPEPVEAPEPAQPEPARAGPPKSEPKPSVKLDPAKAAVDFRLTAQDLALDALRVLGWLIDNAASEAVRVSAANAVMDRAYGRPAQAAQAAKTSGGEPDDRPNVTHTFRWLESGP